MLVFEVNGQQLKRTDKTTVATDSKGYLYAQFNFSSDWNGKAKVAIFLTENLEPIRVVISNNKCLVPYEVLALDEAKSPFKRQCFEITLEGTQDAVKITTNKVEIKVEESGNTEGTTPQEPTADVYSQLLTNYQETQDKYDEAKTENENNANIYCNALKGNASGEAVKITDISPIEHTADVIVHGKNLIPYPYKDEANSVDGITFTPQADGGIALSGTPTASFVSFELYQGKPLITKGNITISLFGEFTGVYLRFNIKDATGNSLYSGGVNSNSTTINLDNYPTATIWDIFVRNTDDLGEFTGVLYPQIETGDTATEYTPYIDPSATTLTKCGKNLIPNKSETNTVNGITKTMKTDGSVTLNGTATGIAWVGLHTAYLPPAIYFLSGAKDSSYSLVIDAYKNGTYIKGSHDTGNGAKLDLTNADYDEVRILAKVEKGTTLNNVTFKPMLEIGTEATTYEIYNATSYTPNADGTVNGVTLANNATLITDTDNIIIECEYNKDINKAFAELLAKLTT